GVIPLDTSRLTRIGAPAEAARHSDWDQISQSSTAVRGIGYVAWYPMATEAASLSDTGSVPDAIGRWKRREMSTEFRVSLCLVSNGAGLPAPVMNDPKTGVAAGTVGGTPDRSERCNEHLFSPLSEMVP